MEPFGQAGIASISRSRTGASISRSISPMRIAYLISSVRPRTRVVILSMHADEKHVAQALQLGVSGYVLKDSFVDELPVLVRAVMRGETYLSPGISNQVVEALKARLGGAAPEAELLTPRQREILQLVAEGKSTKEIAAALELSIKTVETHRAQIMQRLQIRDVAGLVRYAIRAGLVSA